MRLVNINSRNASWYVHQGNTLARLYLQIQVLQDRHFFTARVLERDILETDDPATGWVDLDADSRIDDGLPFKKVEDTDASADTSHY